MAPPISSHHWYEVPADFLLPAFGNVVFSSAASIAISTYFPLAGKHWTGFASLALGAVGSGIGQLDSEAFFHDSVNWRKIAGTALQTLVSGGEAFLGQDYIFPHDPLWKKGLTHIGKQASFLYKPKGFPSLLLSSAFNLVQSEINRSYVESNGLWQRIVGDQKWDWSYFANVAIDLGLGGVAFATNRYITPKMSDTTLEQEHIQSSAKDYFNKAIMTFNYSRPEAKNANVRAGEYFVSREPNYARTCFNYALMGLPCELDSSHMPMESLRPYSLYWRASQGYAQAWDELLQPPAKLPWWAFRQRQALYPKLLYGHQQKAIQEMENGSFEAGLAHLVEADKLSRKIGLKGRHKEGIAAALARPRLWPLEKMRLRTNIDKLKKGLDEEYGRFYSQLLAGTFQNSETDLVTILYHNYEIVLRGMRRLDPQSGRDILKRQHFIVNYMADYLTDLSMKTPSDDNLRLQAALWIKRTASTSDALKA